MEKVYGFVWHIVTDELVTSEGSSGAYCRAFETESENELAAATIIHVMVRKDMAACTVSGCEHTPIVVSELSPKMIMSDMTANMRNVETPTSKRELILRVISALGSLTTDQLDEAIGEFPKEIRAFLNDSKYLKKPSQKEVTVFDLGINFLGQVYPYVIGHLAK